MAKKAHDEEVVTIPVVEERAVVSKRTRITGAVHVTTDILEHEELIERPVMREELTVERVSVDRWVEAPAEVRQEGDVTIIPVHAEILVVETRLKLVEEIRVHRRRTTTRAEERVLLRREEAAVERLAPADDEVR